MPGQRVTTLDFRVYHQRWSVGSSLVRNLNFQVSVHARYFLGLVANSFLRVLCFFPHLHQRSPAINELEPSCGSNTVKINSWIVHLHHKARWLTDVLRVIFHVFLCGKVCECVVGIHNADSRLKTVYKVQFAVQNHYNKTSLEVSIIDANWCLACDFSCISLWQSVWVCCWHSQCRQ